MNSDSPINSRQEDTLDRSSFAMQLAEAIVKHDKKSSFNIGLYGEWGSGKTSLLNMLEESFNNISEGLEHKPVILRFNPWLFSDHRQLIKQFFKQLSTVIKKEKNFPDEAWKTIDKYADAFEIVSIVPVVGGLFSGIGKLLSKQAKDYINGKENDLQKIKNELTHLLSIAESKTIIIIDDIDRLSNEEIRTVFQLVKSIADFPNMIYILAFDYGIVINALEEIQKNDGAKYLEKIIQVPFHLPAVTEQNITNTFLSQLNEIIGEVPEEKLDKDRFSLLYHNGIKPLLSTVRDIVRLNNKISLKYSFLKDEINIVDLIGITTIQVFFPDVYVSMSAYRDMLCGDFSYYSSDSIKQEEFKKWYNFLASSLSETKRNILSEIFSFLFPKARLLRQGLSSISYNGYSSFRKGNIYNKDFFNRYFSLTLSEGISLKQANYLIFETNEESFSNLLLELDDKSQTNLILDYISSIFTPLKKSDTHVDRVTIILFCMLTNWNNLHDTDVLQFFSTPWNWRLNFLTNCLLWVFSKETERYSIIESFFNDVRISLSVKLQILSYFEQEHNRFNEEKDDLSQEEPVFSLENVLLLEKITCSKIIESMKTKELFKEPSLGDIRWFIKSHDNSEIKTLFSSYLEESLNDDHSMALFIASFVGHGKTAITFVYETWNMDLKKMSDYFDLEEAKIRMEKFIKTESFTELQLNIKEDLLAFLAYYEERNTPDRDSVGRRLIETYAKSHNIVLG